jgi:hypothetical protein
LLRRVARGVLSIHDTCGPAQNCSRSRADAGATATADRAADRGSETCAEKGAAQGLGIRLALQRGDLLAGILPARRSS